MGWTFERDSERLAEAAVDTAMEEIARVCSTMYSEHVDMYGKEHMQLAADFWEFCQSKLNEKINKKIEQLKERAK